MRLSGLVERIGHASAPVRRWTATAQCRAEHGMTTAEYAVGTVAACGFAGVLFKVVTSDSVSAALARVISRALSTTF